MTGRSFERANRWAGILALFLVLTGGTALAVDGSLPGQNTVGSADIIDGEVTPDDIKAEAIGSTKIADRQVKNADLSIGASSSNTIADGGIDSIDVKNDTLTGADILESSLVPGDADTLDGQDSSDLAPAAAEDWHEIGAPGEPGFRVGSGCTWSNYGGAYNTAAFYKDPWGVVHLKGLVKAIDVPDNGDGQCDTADLLIFQLPFGQAYRPAETVVHATVSGDHPSRVDIMPYIFFIGYGTRVLVDPNVAGAVANAKTYLSLDGIAFRAG